MFQLQLSARWRTARRRRRVAAACVAAVSGWAAIRRRSFTARRAPSRAASTSAFAAMHRFTPAATVAARSPRRRHRRRRRRRACSAAGRTPRCCARCVRAPTAAAPAPADFTVLNCASPARLGCIRPTTRRVTRTTSFDWTDNNNHSAHLKLACAATSRTFGDKMWLALN